MLHELIGHMVHVPKIKAILNQSFDNNINNNNTRLDMIAADTDIRVII